LDNPTIGIRIANGTFFPILKEDDRAKKRLVLSPVKEKQKDVKIDIFRGEGEGMYDPVYVGSLILNNINHKGGKVPDIELLISVSDAGILDVQASEPISGVKQFLSVSLDSIDSNIDFYNTQDSGDSVDAPRFSSDFDEDPGMDNEDEESEEARWGYDAEKDNKKKKTTKIAVIVLIVLLLLLLGFLIFTLIAKPALAKRAEQRAAESAVAVVPEAREPERAAPVAVPQPEPVRAAEPEPAAVAEPTPAEPERTAEYIRYRIVWGDTLWDISNTFYRTPWLYRRIARDNNIRNPDRIYAGNWLIIKAE